MESVIDIMNKNNIQWRKEWPFTPIVDFRYTEVKKKEKKESEGE